MAATLTIGLGCAEPPPEPPPSYAARVDDSYLSEEELARLVAESRAEDAEHEAIRRWIETETLFREAVREGVLEDPEYLRLVQETRKELAASFLARKYYEDNPPTATDDEARAFFDDRRDLFAASEESYLLDVVAFERYEAAEAFRELAESRGWEAARAEFEDRASASEREVYRRPADFFAAATLEAARASDPGDVVVAFNPARRRYEATRIVRRIKPFEPPPFEAVKEKAREAVARAKMKQSFDEYVQQLYEERTIEIR